MNFIEGLSFARLTNANSVVGEGAVAGCDRFIDIAVAIIVVSRVPVGPIKANAWIRSAKV